MTTSLFGNRITTWFTADQLLGDETARLRRPFDSVEQMNETIIDRHNMLVEEHDIVWLLGGLCLGDDDSLALVSRLNGRKYLIAGRQDLCFAGNTPDAKQREEQVRRYLAAGIKHVSTGTGIALCTPGGKHLGSPVRLRLGGHPLVLSHFPYVTSGGDEFAAWRPRHIRGSVSPWLAHGDVHNAWRVQNRQINVGADVWNYSPVPAEVVTEIINEEDERAS